MSRRKKGKKSYPCGPNRREIQSREAEKELRNAQFGKVEESSEEIAQQVDRELREEESVKREEISFSRRCYVLDTNLIISCVDILYDPDDEDWREPLDFKPSLDNAHIIIPQVVFDELDNMKGQVTQRGMIARIAFGRLKKLFPNSGRTIGEILNLEKPIPTGWKNQLISILPLHRNFSNCLPYVPKDDDNDGKIALTALEASMILEGLPIDGTAENILERSNKSRDVILLTNDNPLLSRADEYAVRVKSYSFKRRPIYTGVRELTVPAEMFHRLYYGAPVTEEEFRDYMPDETPLIANEYLIMTPEDDNYPLSYFADSEKYASVARFHKENGKICPLRNVKKEGKEPPNLGIAIYYDALNDDDIQVINVTGPAGTGKTYNAVQHAIREMKRGRFIKTVIISTLPAKNPLGAPPGGEDRKKAPLVAAIKSAIASFLSNTPEFKRRREILKKYGDQDPDDFGNQEEARGETYEEKGKGNYRNSSRSNANRTLGSFTGSFDDLDFMGDYSPEDFGDQHSRKKKAKKKNRGAENQDQFKGADSKMSYSDLLEKQTNYIFSRYFRCEPFEMVQGLNLEDTLVIIDEAQRLKIDDADTALARPAKGSKLILCGDIRQIHDSTEEKRYQNAIVYSRELYFDWEGCANVRLTENTRGDIARVMSENRRKVRQKMGLI
ncbi:MAG: PhoH family protein [Candidatus Saccharibacteria bacterium]|nr:PhoH family protein [Candidatus Saccharibacteria bacterium]